MAKKKSALGTRVSSVLLGIFLFFSLVEIALRSVGFMFLLRQDLENRASAGQKSTYTVLCIGESATAVAADAHNNFLIDKTSYPRQLEKILNQKAGGADIRVINKGMLNSDSGQILNEIEAHLDKYKPDMVVAMMGMRDVASTALFNAPGAGKKTRHFWDRLKIWGVGRALLVNLLERGGKQIDGAYAEEYKKNPNMASAHYYEARGGYDRAEKFYRKEIAKNHEAHAYIGLAMLHVMQGKYEEAEKILLGAIKIKPHSSLYAALARHYREQKRFLEAENILREAVSMASGNALHRSLYLEFGKLYKDTGKYSQAEEMYKKSFGGNFDDEVYLELGLLYRMAGRHRDAEEMLKDGLATQPEKHLLYDELGKFYKDTGRYAEQEHVYRKAIEANRKFGDYLDLAEYYKKRGSYIEALKIIDAACLQAPSLKNNYNMLREILTRKGIVLIAMQYPGYSVDFLKHIFSSLQGVTFVDNEDIFAKGDEREFYFERSYRRMPHYSSRGAELIAINLSGAVLEYIGRQARQ